MDATEFEIQYAARSGITVAELHEMKRYAFTCWCDYEGCAGWQIITIGSLTDTDLKVFPIYDQVHYHKLSLWHAFLDSNLGKFMIWCMDRLANLLEKTKTPVK